MKANVVLVVLFIFLHQLSLAQITQVEFASGFSKTDFTSFSLQPFNKSHTLSIATLAFFQKFHQEEDTPFDEAGVQITPLWNFSKWASVGPTLYYNSAVGFSERISLVVSPKVNNFIFTTIFAVVHTEKTNTVHGEWSMQMQFTQPLTKDWSLILSLATLSNWRKFSAHDRSFQQLRAGVSYGTTQFGLASDLDQYGEDPITKTSLGFFVRKNFINQ